MLLAIIQNLCVDIPIDFTIPELRTQMSCGKTKGCFGYGCKRYVQEKRCAVLATYKYVIQSENEPTLQVQLEVNENVLKLAPPRHFFVSLTLSKDKTLGKDLVFVCSNNPNINVSKIKYLFILKLKNYFLEML